MREDHLLLTPGPVPLTPRVSEAMDRPMISHRSPAFSEVYARAAAGLQYVFTHSTHTGASTAEGGTVLILNGTATMGMEAAVSNLVDPDDEVLALVNGKFGRRFRRIADRYCRVTEVSAEWGSSFDREAVAAAIGDDVDVVTMVHNETSTGLLNPVEAVGELVADHDATFVVDGVTSIGGDEFRVDDWGVDVAITDAQKALAAPPGVSAMYVSDGAAAAFDGDRGPFYHDLDAHLEKAEANQTPFTSAVPLVAALAEAVEQIEAETMPVRIERHHRQSAAFREGYNSMGLELFADPEAPSRFSNTVTAVALPEAIRDSHQDFFAAVEERGVSVAGGQSHLGGRIFRVSNMGNLSPEEVIRGVVAVGEALREVGVDVDVDDGESGARSVL